MTENESGSGSGGQTPKELEDLHEAPWSRIEGAYVRVRQEVDNRDPLDPTQNDREDLVTSEEREGELVGRGEGRGLYYDSEHGRNIPMSIGPAIYLDTPEDTILEVRTGKLDNELLAFEASDEDGGQA